MHVKTYSMKVVGRIEVINIHTVNTAHGTCCHWCGFSLVFVLSGRLVTYMRIADVLSFHWSTTQVLINKQITLCQLSFVRWEEEIWGSELNWLWSPFIEVVAEEGLGTKSVLLNFTFYNHEIVTLRAIMYCHIKKYLYLMTQRDGTVYNKHSFLYAKT